MADKNYFTDAAVKKLVRDHQRLAQQIYNLQRERRQQGKHFPRQGTKPIWFRNDSGEAIPAYGVVADGGLVLVNGVPNGLVSGQKPSTTFRRRYFFNGDLEVPPGGVAKVQQGEFQKAAYDAGTPANGDGWGPKPGQWTLSKGYPSTTTVSGIVDSTNKVLLGTLGPINILIGKLAEACSVGETDVDVDIWTDTADSTVNLNVNDWLMKSGATDIASGKKVVCQWINNKWYITEAECA